MLMKVLRFVGRVCKATHITKEAGETIEFMVEAYGKVAAITHDSQTIAGLIGSASSGS